MKNNSYVYKPLAFCPEHGIFEYNGIRSDGPVKVVMTGCETNCASCGRMCEVLPGEYEFAGERLNLLLDNSISSEALKAVRELAEKVQAGEITEEEAVKEAKKVAPGLSALFRFSDYSPEARAHILGAIITSVSIITAAKIATPPTQNVNVVADVPQVEESYDLRPLTVTQSMRLLKNAASIPALRMPMQPIPKPKPM